MVPIGESYRPQSTLDLRSLLAISILGVITGIVCAGGVWLWEISPIPTLMIVTPLVQGAGVAFILSILITRLKTRNPLALGVIGFTCGLLSALLVHFGHHLHLISEISKAQRAHVLADQTIPEAEKHEILATLDANPTAAADEAIATMTGYRGFVGTMILRNENGITIKGAKTTGWFLWGVWIAEGLIVAMIAAMAASVAASKPFCEECHHWCKELPQFSLPAGQAPMLIDALRNNLPATVAALRAEEAPPDLKGTAVLSLQTCPECDLSFADVNLQVPMKKDQVKQSILLKNVLVSPEMVQVCRAPVGSLRQPATAPESDEAGEASAEEDVEV